MVRFSILFRMRQKFKLLIVLFALLLFAPFVVQMVVDLKSEKRFRSLDIFKDVIYTPFVRQHDLTVLAGRLTESWRNARESIAAGQETSEALEPVIAALSDLEAEALTINAYAQMDTSEWGYRLLKHADTLLASLEDEPENFLAVDSSLKALMQEFGSFSVARAFYDIKRYGAWNGWYLRAFESKVEDENAVVLALRPRYQLAVWKAFGDAGEKVVPGKQLGDASKPWLFYRQDVEFLVQPSPLDVRAAKLDNPIEAITRFRDQLRTKGVELLVVVVPGKPSIYPERLTGKTTDNVVFGHGQVIIDSLAKLGFNTVDLYSPLWSAKSNDGEKGSLYLDDDTHWTPRGAELAAEVIAAKVLQMKDAGEVDFGPKGQEYVTVDSLADSMGDIGEMRGLNKYNVFQAQRVTGHVVMQQNVALRDSVVVASLTGDSVALRIADTTRMPFKDDFRKSKILILGDSFSRIYQTDAPVNAGWISHFAMNVKQPVSSIVSDGGASTLVREKLARKAGVLKGKKLLIWEFVERDLRFGAEGWKDVDILN